MNPDFQSFVGGRITQARQEKNMTQAELGERLREPRTHAAISSIENGKDSISVTLLAELAEILGKRIGYFLSGEEDLVEELRPVEGLFGLRRQMFEAHGPFDGQYRFTWAGFRIPYITGSLVKGSENKWDIIGDERYMLPDPVSEAELKVWLPFLANMMAVAAGFSSHGNMSRPVNPFAVRMSGISLDKDQ